MATFMLEILRGKRAMVLHSEGCILLQRYGLRRKPAMLYELLKIAVATAEILRTKSKIRFHISIAFPISFGFVRICFIFDYT